MEEVEKKWQELFAHIFNGFSNDRILEEARDTLAAMGHHVEWDDKLMMDIPPNAPLLVVRRSLCQDWDTHLGGYFTFDVAVGPHYTEDVYSGVNEYGLLRLQFGLDGSYQDDYFYPSPLQWVDKARQYKPVMRVVADKREGYEEIRNLEDS
jgi:hypothetical protein